MNPNETRSSHPSSVQVETLVEFMERNPGLAKGFLRTQHARERSRRQWEELAVRLNSLGGTIKSYKQWTKYWADKKNATKKKVAARAAARRRTGGGVEEVVELSELEERIVALCGGEGFSTGDAHLAIEPFPESQEIQNVRTDNGSQEMADSQQRSVHSINVARRLFDSSSSSAVETSQNIFQDLQLETVAEPALSYHPSLSPPPITLSQTPSPLPMPTPSPSRRGSTQVIRRRNAASSSIRQVNISRSTPISSPSRRTRVHASREPESVLRLCVVEGRGSYKRTLKNCPVLDKESSGVECVLGTDRLDCLRRINKGTVDFGAFSPEDLIAAQWAGVDVLVTNELRYRSKPFERSVVAVVNRRILSDEPMPVRALLKNRTLCHPGSGVDDLRPLSFTLSAYLEFQVLSRDCLDDLSLAENRVKALADFFGSSCKAGAWVVDKNRDAQLKRKYSSLCAACGSSSCSANDPYWGSSGALACLAEVGDVAWGELVDVQAYFGLSEPRGKSLRPPAEKYAYLCRDGSHQPLETPEPCVWLQRPWPVIVAKRGLRQSSPADGAARQVAAPSSGEIRVPLPRRLAPAAGDAGALRVAAAAVARHRGQELSEPRGKSLRPPAEKYAYLCRDGSHQPLETPEPCVWLQRPWPVIVAKRRASEAVANLALSLHNNNVTVDPHWRGALAALLEIRSAQPEPLQPPVTPADYLARARGFREAYSQTGCVPPSYCLVLYQDINDVTVDPHWRGALAALLEIRSAQPEPLQPPVTPADYLAKARGFREAYAYSQTGCVPPRHITFCTTSNLERNKCEWLSEAGAVYGVAPSIQCAIANSTSECMKAVANGDAHIVAADSNWLMKAERDYNLTAVLHEATPIVDKTHTVVANVLTDSHINKMADLRGKRVAFPEYDGVAWHSVLRYLKNKEELSCGDFKGYFKEICAPGVSQSVIEQAKVFTTTCYEEGLSGEMQALKALVEGKTDVAFISMETYKTYRAKLISQPWASEPLQLNPVCPEDNPKYCFISWANIGHIYASKNISTMRHQEIVNVFTKLDQLFGKQYPFHNSIFSMYGPFNHQPDVLFHNSTKNLITDDSLKSQPYSRIPLNFERSLSNSTDSCQAEEIANLSAKIQPGLLVMMVSLVVYLIS